MKLDTRVRYTGNSETLNKQGIKGITGTLRQTSGIVIDSDKDMVQVSYDDVTPQLAIVQFWVNESQLKVE
jgi:hypothetical protein